jgi:hypothetical protein
MTEEFIAANSRRAGGERSAEAEAEASAQAPGA